MKIYCMQRGTLHILTSEEAAQLKAHKISCFKQAEVLLDAAKVNIEAARLLIQDSKRYD